jgi:hypothetical protein
VAPLRAIYRRALQVGQVTHNPTRDMALPAPRPPERRIADPSVAEKILEALELRDRALWATALFAGIGHVPRALPAPQSLDPGP